MQVHNPENHQQLITQITTGPQHTLPTICQNNTNTHLNAREQPKALCKPSHSIASSSSPKSDISYREGITVVSSHDVIFKLNFHLISYLPIDLSLRASSQRVQGAESTGAIRFARYAGIVELSSTVNMVRTDA